MPLRYKPTAEDKRIIRQCAQRSAGQRRVEICPGSRYNITGAFDPSIESLNIAFVAAQDDWEDTDLADNSWRWSDFTRGVELTDDGRGIFDFYVYSVGRDAELETNVTAYYEGGKLARVTGTGDGVLWGAA